MPRSSMSFQTESAFFFKSRSRILVQCNGFMTTFGFHRAFGFAFLAPRPGKPGNPGGPNPGSIGGPPIPKGGGAPSGGGTPIGTGAPNGGGAPIGTGAPIG